MAASLNVLHSTRRWSSRSRSSHSASSSSRSRSSPCGQQAAALQLDQGGRDEQELAGHVEVELLHALELDEVAVDDRRQADLVEVDLLGQDEVEQQVERPLEHRGLHRVGHRDDDNHAAVVPRCTLVRRAAPGPAATGTSSGPGGAPSTIAAHGPRVLRHPAHRRGPPRQLPGCGPALGRRAARRRRHLLHRRPARPDHPQGPGRAAGQDPRADPAPRGVGLDPEVVHAVRPEPRARARRAGLDHGVHGQRSASCGA